MILKLLVTRRNITLIPKEATEQKEKENFKMEKEEEKKSENQNMSKRKMINIPATKRE